MANKPLVPLKNAVREIEVALESANELEKIDQKEIDAIANKYAHAKSPFLAAVAGSIIGAGAGITIAPALGGLIVISGPAGLLLGAALGVLAWRGKDYFRNERKTENLKMALDELDDRIRCLPDDAPSHVRDGLWNNFSAIMSAYQEAVVSTMKK